MASAPKTENARQQRGQIRKGLVQMGTPSKAKGDGHKCFSKYGLWTLNHLSHLITCRSVGTIPNHLIRIETQAPILPFNKLADESVTHYHLRSIPQSTSNSEMESDHSLDQFSYNLGKPGAISTRGNRSKGLPCSQWMSNENGPASLRSRPK